jgi:hypothetical protein
VQQELRRAAVLVTPMDKLRHSSAVYTARWAAPCPPSGRDVGLLHRRLPVAVGAAVIAGVIPPHEGLSTTFEIFAAITGVVALIMSLEAYRTRPTTKP